MFITFLDNEQYILSKTIRVIDKWDASTAYFAANKPSNCKIRDTANLILVEKGCDIDHENVFQRVQTPNGMFWSLNQQFYDYPYDKPSDKFVFYSVDTTLVHDIYNSFVSILFGDIDIAADRNKIYKTSDPLVFQTFRRYIEMKLYV